MRNGITGFRAPAAVNEGRMRRLFDVQNPDGRLRAGLYVTVTFAIPRDKPTVLVPAEALIFNQQGLQVAVVDSDDKIHLKPVSIYRDFGKTVELRDGLEGGERVVLSPPTNLQDGNKVKIAPDAPAPAPPAKREAEK